MKIVLLTVSLVLNAILAVVCFQSKESTSSGASVATPKTKVLTRTIIQEVTAPAVTNVVLNSSEDVFHWSSIQSTNFVGYAEALRRIGCPNQTIRDIISGEINDLSIAQRRVLMAPYASRFWEFAAKDNFDIPDQLSGPLAELKKKRNDLMTQALKDYPKSNTAPKPQPKKDPTLATLPPEKQEQIKALDQKYAALRKEVGNDKKLSPEEKQKKTRDLQIQFEKEKQGMMSPEELAEYNIRRQSTSFQNLYGFKTDEEELRAIAAVYAKQSAGNDPDKPVSDEDRREMNKQRDAELKKLLGDTRYAEYKRGSDNSYRILWQIAAAYNLPEETAHKAYEVHVASTEQARAIEKHPSMTPEEKESAFRELQDQAEDATAAIMGEKAAKSYQRLFPSR